MKDLTVISLFAGCGGSSLGYKMAGYKELLAIDFDEKKKLTFEKNFTDVPYWNKNICKVIPEEILSFCKIIKGELDLLDMSPPCQGFSLCKNERNVNDDKNNLLFETVRFINEILPKVFVIENVIGLIIKGMKGYFLDLIDRLNKLDYIIKYKKINMANYGIPQKRVRIFIIGVKKEIVNKIEKIFPIPCEKVVVKSVLENVNNDPEEVKKLILNSKLCSLWKMTDYGKSICAIYEKIYHKRKYYTLYKLNPNSFCNTIITTQVVNFSGILHWNEPRHLTIQELKRISTFPDDFIFIGNYREQSIQIGNAVPPKMVYHIAKHLKKNILEKYYGNTYQEIYT